MMKKISIIHTMAKSGGTVVCKCLGPMDGVAMLSEIHPKGPYFVRGAFNENMSYQFSPLVQAAQWFGFGSLSDINKGIVFGGDNEFVGSINQIVTYAEQQNKRIVIRDWSHIDVIGKPFCPPIREDSLGKLLKPHFEVDECALLRHPLKQWLSMQSRDAYKTTSLNEYLSGYLAYLKIYKDIPWVKYEEVVENPNEMLGKICQHLGIEYDLTWEDKWTSYTTLTGDSNATKSVNAKLQEKPIGKLEKSLVAQLKKNKYYKSIIEMTAYPELLKWN
jgi:hypothetical protein